MNRDRIDTDSDFSWLHGVRPGSEMDFLETAGPNLFVNAHELDELSYLTRKIIQDGFVSLTKIEQAKAFELAGLEPTRDAAEGVGGKRRIFNPRDAGFTLADCGCREDECERRTDGTCHYPTLEVAPPKPAPDAVREAIADKIERLGFVGSDDLTESEVRTVVASLRSATPVPPADGKLEAVRQEIVLAISFLGRDSSTDRLQTTVDALIPGLARADAILRSFLHPSGTGAAESERISFSRKWIEQIRDELMKVEKLPSGPLGDWAFLFREQLSDALSRQPPQSSSE